MASPPPPEAMERSVISPRVPVVSDVARLNGLRSMLGSAFKDRLLVNQIAMPVWYTRAGGCLLSSILQPWPQCQQPRSQLHLYRRPTRSSSAQRVLQRLLVARATQLQSPHLRSQAPAAQGSQWLPTFHLHQRRLEELSLLQHQSCPGNHGTGICG